MKCTENEDGRTFNLKNTFIISSPFHAHIQNVGIIFSCNLTIMATVFNKIGHNLYRSQALIMPK